MKKQLEQPFEYLKRKDGSAFAPETVKHWYEARAYVLDQLRRVAVGPNSKQHLHAVVTGDSPLMLSVVRQLALSAHYPNYDENTGRNRTVITLVSKNEHIIDELKKEEYLCNLPDFFQCLYIDIELQIVKEWHGEDHDALIMSEEDVKAFLSTKNEQEIYWIDTRKAVLADRMYSLGAVIDNLPDEDIHCAGRYILALDVFKGLLRKRTKPLINEQKWNSDQIRVRNGLSNINSADCYELKAEEIGEENNEAYSISEHNRWVTEKLIMGFRPLNKMERIRDERLFDDAKTRYRNKLKKNPADPAHVDICSYAELRRIDPESLKYDSCLMLAIKYILKRVR